MSNKNKLDLLLREVADRYSQENFYKIKTFLENLEMTTATGATGPQGPAGPKGDPGTAGVSYTFTQNTPLSSWVVNHNLGFYPTVEIFTLGGAEVNADVLHTSANQTIITFAAPFAGFARFV